MKVGGRNNRGRHRQHVDVGRANEQTFATIQLFGSGKASDVLEYDGAAVHKFAGCNRTLLGIEHGSMSSAVKRRLAIAVSLAHWMPAKSFRRLFAQTRAN
jgi:hypothetical protein